MGLISWLLGSGTASSGTTPSARDHDPAFAHEVSNVYHGSALDPTAPASADPLNMTGINPGGLSDASAVASNDGTCGHSSSYEPDYGSGSSYGCSSFGSDSFGSSSFGGFGSDSFGSSSFGGCGGFDSGF